MAASNVGRRIPVSSICAVVRNPAFGCRGAKAVKLGDKMRVKCRAAGGSGATERVSD
jgi:hypothetical protein